MSDNDKNIGSTSGVTSGVIGGIVDANGNKRAADDRFFLTKLTSKGGDWAKRNPVKTTIGAAIVGPVIAQRVISPAYDWAKRGVKGLVGKKVEDRISSEAKNAMSAGDILGLVAGSVGKLIK